MESKNEIIKVLKEKKSFLKQEYGLKKIALFGAYAKDTQNKNSDIDMLVEFERPIGLKFVDLTEYLEKLFGRKIDILTPEGLNSIRVESIALKIKKDLVYV